MLPFVSVIVPCRNESGFIVPCLESILSNDYPNDRMEVLVVDGASDDGTRQQISSFASMNAIVRMIDNPRRTTPAALNIGISESRGEVIVRMDAHAAYPASYISRLVSWLEKTGADNVGGVCRTLPANRSSVAKAIAIGLSHPFGVGNSYFRIGVRDPRWVDTVPFGCYRREVFEKIGLFDEELVRNQDDELNLRLVKSGGRILLVPDVVSSYYARDKITKVWRMYFQYGYFKALVFQKHRTLGSWRQLVPALFVGSLIAFGLLSMWFVPVRVLAAAVVLAYLAAVGVVSAAAARRQCGIRCCAVLLCVFPALHLAYGTGSLKGLVDFFILRRRLSSRKRVALTR